MNDRPQFEFKRPPRQKQLEALERSYDAEYFALLMEQRTGKSQVVLDTIAYWYHAGLADALLILAPNGVHRNWVTEEIPVALRDDTRYRTCLWKAGRAKTKAFQTEFEEFLAHDGLAVFSVNVEGIIHESTKTFIRRFLEKRRVFGIVDESLDISNNSSARTKVALKIARSCVGRRILDGTPVDATPLGLFSQFEFLKPGCLGYRNNTAFRTRFATWKMRDHGERNKRCASCAGACYVRPGMADLIRDTFVLPWSREEPRVKPPEGFVTCPRCAGQGVTGKFAFQELQSFQNLDELKTIVDRHSFRVLRSDCADLPPKIYEKRFFELSSAQQASYEELRETYATELRSEGSVTAAMVLTRYLRLQQVTSNFLPIDAEASICVKCSGNGCAYCGELGYVVANGGRPRAVVVDEKRNPRLEALLATIAPLPGKGIVWAKFRYDISTTVKALAEAGRRPVAYFGEVAQEARAKALVDFQRGDADVFVGNPRAGGRGLDLSAANWVVYYSLDWPLRWRRQSEDRAQSLAKTDSVLYVDLVAEGTIDEKVIQALREGKELSDLVTGDPRGSWI